MREVIQYAEALISYIEKNAANLNQPTQQALAKLLQEIFEFIEEQQSPVDGAPPISPEPPPLTPGMPSSNVNSFGYDEDTGKLYVKFQGDYPQQNGPVYEYGGVPKQIFDLFKTGAVPARTQGKNKWGSWWKGKVPSLGASLYTLIKGGNYPYQRVS